MGNRQGPSSASCWVPFISQGTWHLAETGLKWEQNVAQHHRDNTNILGLFRVFFFLLGRGSRRESQALFRVRLLQVQAEAPGCCLHVLKQFSAISQVPSKENEASRHLVAMMLTTVYLCSLHSPPVRATHTLVSIGSQTKLSSYHSTEVNDTAVLNGTSLQMSGDLV